jgi:hypothetical protein
MSKGAACVDAPNFSAGMRAPNIGGMGDAGERKVIDKMTTCGQQHSVFRALDRLADPFGFYITHSTRPTHHQQVLLTTKTTKGSDIYAFQLRELRVLRGESF